MSRFIAWSAAGATLLLLAGCGLSPFSDEASRNQIDLTESFVHDETNPDWPWMDGLTETTAQRCVGDVPCRQAVENEYLVLYQFGEVQPAEEYASAHADTVQIDPLVVEFKESPELDQAAKDDIVHSVSGVNVSSPD